MTTTIDRPTSENAATRVISANGGANIIISHGDYNVVGTRPVRHDGVDKVTGRATYGGDTRLNGLLFGKVLRSPHAHARIVSIDTTKARALDGVHAVVTAADLPTAEDREVNLGEGAGNIKYMSDNILATDKALYKGHAIAAVAAINVHVAEAACKLIEVVYEVLPAVVGIKDAIAPGATLLHPEITQKSLGNDTGIHSNITKHARHQLGDPDAAFAKADVIVEREFTTSMIHQGYIEPTNATAMWNLDGKITIWTSTQGAFAVRDSTSRILGVPVSRVRAIPQEIGGGFGGKVNVYLEPVAALLSRESGRPVKLIMSRAEVFQATGPAPGSWSKIKFGATKDGRLVAMTADLYMESGAYPGSDTGAAMRCIYAPYKCDDMRVDGYDVLTNRPKTAAYRAPGAPQAAFASEQVIDELAEKLGMDPIEFRLRNAAHEGTRQVHGPLHKKVGGIEVLNATKEHAHYRAPLGTPSPSARRGRGVAYGYWFNIGLASSVSISVNGDGSVTLIEGSTDIGGSRASIAMQAAEILGISAEDVRPSVVDTDSVGYTGVTGGSRTTYATGLAAIEAARSVVAQMKARVAKVWSVAPDDVSYEHGSFHAGTHSMSFKEAAHHIEDTGGPVTGTGNVDQQGHGGAFASIIVDVEVDIETGKTQILEWTIVQDAGKAIHPSYVEGQLQGASAQGIGWALSEEYFMNSKGEMANTSLLDYRLPTAFDVPMINTVIVEVPNPGHPFGVRGVGEASIVPPMAAVANAIHNAIGVRMHALPMNPGAVLHGLGVI